MAQDWDYCRRWPRGAMAKSETLNKLLWLWAIKAKVDGDQKTPYHTKVCLES